MTVACTRRGSRGKVYISADDMPFLVPEEKNIHRKIKNLYKRTGLEVPKEPIEINPRSMDVDHWGFEKWRDLFTPRQLMCLLNFVWASREAEPQMDMQGYANEQKKAVATMMGAILDRLVDFNSTLCVFNYTGGRGVVHTFGRQSIPMVWDFAETDPFNPAGASWVSGIQDLPAGLRDANMRSSGIVKRGSAMDLPWPKSYFDAVITDPPYYDNVSYSNLSDFFYVWLKKTVGHLYPDHFASKLTPKKSEAIAAFYRHGGDKVKSRDAYEFMMAEAFRQANLVLKPNGHMVVVYAHKTTLGWATLIDSLQSTGFVVTEAWPINTEKPGRLLAQNTAALASSIFLVARKRDGSKIGSYENEVRSELRKIVLERVDTFWGMGITGADLVIAAVGAGLRAFTRFARVEYANGEEVHAEKFLIEIETVVLENILKRLSKEVGANSGKFSLAGVDAATRFYILWRYTYKYSVLDAGEAIIFANGTHVELDGPNGLASGAKALLEKKKGKYRLKDFSDRGSDNKLGQMMEEGQAAPMIDALHRALWLMENRPGELPTFLQEAQPNREQMRLVAQALAGPALKGGELGERSPHAELSALAKLTANWKSLIEGASLTVREKKAQDTGQTSWLK